MTPEHPIIHIEIINTTDPQVITQRLRELRQQYRAQGINTRIQARRRPKYNDYRLYVRQFEPPDPELRRAISKRPRKSYAQRMKPTTRKLYGAYKTTYNRKIALINELIEKYNINPQAKEDILKLTARVARCH
eukprot:g38184.t1